METFANNIATITTTDLFVMGLLIGGLVGLMIHIFYKDEV